MGFVLGSGGGPSGLRPAHLQDLLREDRGSASMVVDALDGLIRTAFDGDIPMAAAPFLCAASLIPLQKPCMAAGDIAVRPVAVGEADVRHHCTEYLSSMQGCSACLAPSFPIELVSI